MLDLMSIHQANLTMRERDTDSMMSFTLASFKIQISSTMLTLTRPLEPTSDACAEATTVVAELSGACRKPEIINDINEERS